MSNLRLKKREVIPEEDVEAPLIFPPKRDAAASPAASPMSVKASNGRTNNPALLVRLVLRKVLDQLSGDEDSGDITTLGGILALLKDIVIGIICGTLIMSTIIFLDHRNVIHLQSAHNYRNMAITILSDPDTREEVQEASGLIFLRSEDYERKVIEIKSVPTKVKDAEEKKKKVIADLEVIKKERDTMKPGYDELVKHPSLGLERYCGDCNWQGGTNCNARKDYLMSTYNLKEIKAKIEMMKSLPQCVKKD
ncbi:hypothetical protein ACHAXA_009072 [Cyclostephanos tholiformis]|uniref:Uncharacterized protein n=1 Tax=Cyclostephanos tholiformis TaxID=382380 RepID=A0ABD3SQJ2_9STRA